jgi:voltage-gated potassium channel
MDILRQAGVAVVLVTLTLFLQGGGMAALINWGIAHFARDKHRLGPVRSTALVVRLTSVMIALHMLQILLWAAFYRSGFFPSWESAFYFSTANYTTVGCADPVLPPLWRNLGPVESVTGVLMCGLSASFLFAIVTRLVDRETRFSQEEAHPDMERTSPPTKTDAKALLYFDGVERFPTERTQRI